MLTIKPFSLSLSIITLFFSSQLLASTTWVPIQVGDITTFIPYNSGDTLPAPSNVHVSSNNNSTVLTWDDVENASQYEIQGLNAQGNWVNIANISGLSTTIDSRFNGYTAIRIQACSHTTCSSSNSWSTTVSIQAANIEIVDIKNLDLENGSFDVHWTTDNTQNSFEIERKLADGSWTSKQTVTNTNTLSVTSLSPGRYKFRVRSLFNGNYSGYKESAYVNLTSFNESATVTATKSLTGLSNDVGTTGGQFRVNESGAATYNIPLNLPAGVAGVKPEVSLGYSSQGGGGILGHGWSLNAGGAISRCPKNMYHNDEISGVEFNDNDIFCLNGQQLILISGTYGAANSTYTTNIDSFSVITAVGDATDSGPQSFTVETKSGDTYYYGNTTDSFVEPNNPDGNNGLAKYWALAKIVDVKGNAIEYHYTEDAAMGKHVLSSIEYGDNINVSSAEHFNEITFNYRTDGHYKPKAGYVGGSSVLMNDLLESITITEDGASYRYYDLNYFGTHVVEEKTYLDSITECIAEDTNCLSPVTFTWERPAAVVTTTSTYQICEPMPGGEPPICESYERANTTNYTPFTALTEDVTSTSENRDYAKFIDINADGYSDYIYEHNGWKVIYGPSFDNSPVHMSSTGSSDTARAYAQIIDYDGDGKQDLLVANDDDSNWHVLTYQPGTPSEPLCIFGSCFEIPARSVADIDLGITAVGYEGEAQVMDIDGDGLQDIMFQTSTGLKVYFNDDNEDGIAGDFSGANSLPLSDSTTTIGFDNRALSNTAKMKNSSAIDINGDGRSDLITKISSTQIVPARCQRSDGSIVDDIDADTSAGCRDMGATWHPETSSTITRWKLYVASGDRSNPSLEFRTTIGYNGDNMRVADLNGDGLTDLIYRQTGDDQEWQYNLSNGYDFNGWHLTGHTSTTDEVHSTYFIDLNSDGRADILKPTSSTNWQLLLSVPYTHSTLLEWQSRGNLARDNDNAVRFGDVNGDGKFDILTTQDNDGWDIKYGKAKDTIEHVITDIDNGWGITTSITYDNLLKDTVNLNTVSPYHGSDTISPQFPMSVVKRVDSDSNHGERVAVSYKYGGYLLHRKGLGSLGFNVLQTTDEQTGVITQTTYSQNTADFATIGIPETTAQFIVSGETTNIMQESRNILASKATANGAVFAYIESTTDTSYQPQSNGTFTKLGSTLTTYDYDTSGNLTESKANVYINAVFDTSNTLTDGALVHSTLTENTYAGLGGGAAKGRLSKTEVTKATSDLTEQCAGTSNLCRESAFVYYADGMLKDSVVNGLTTRFTYDDFGHKTTIAKIGLLNDGDATATTLTTSTTYSDDGRLITSTTDSTGSTITIAYNGVDIDNVSGRINQVSTTDVNGITSTKYIDTWNSEIAVKSPASAYKYTKTNYCGAGSCSTDGAENGYYYVEVTQAGAPTQRTVFDKFGRETVSKVTAFDGGFNYTFKDYDNQGRILKEYNPTASITRSTTADGFTKYNYDNYGRVTSIELPKDTSDYEGTFENPSTTFSGFSTVKEDSKGNETTELHNALGQLTLVTDDLGNTLTYNYDTFGNLKTVVKSDGSINITQVTNVFNAYGEKTQTNDVDKGTWNYRYNAFGKLIWQENANNDAVTTQFDNVGRKVRQYSNDYTQCWVYGANNTANIALHRVNRVIATKYFEGTQAANCNSTAYAQGSTVEYDSAGRVFHSVQTLKNEISPLNGEYHTYTNFDTNNGRTTSQYYPSLGLTIDHEYNSYGYLTRLVNARTERVYQDIKAMNARGQTTEVDYANGTTETMAYYGSTGSVKSHNVTKGSTSHHYLQYKYESNGNLAYRRHEFGNLASSADYEVDYKYDELNRLDERNVTVQTQGDAPSTFTVTQTYGYDGFGNFTHKGNTSNTYIYGTNKRLNSANVNSQLYSFDYDDNGNITNDGRRSLVYGSFDKVTQIIQGNTITNFTYGMGHKRFSRHDTRQNGDDTVNTYTAYLGSHEKIYRTGKDSPLLEYKFYVGNVVITERANATNSTSTQESYLHKDHLGSPLTITNKSGNVIQHKVYDPWGKGYAVHTDSAISLANILPPTTREFTGHESVQGMDIIHMNGRIYDPTLGRFLQADPIIQAPKNSQSYNRYAYVINNPLRYTDPSGYSFFDKLLRPGKHIIRGVMRALGKGATQFLITVGCSQAGYFAPLCFAGANYDMARAFGSSSTGALKAGITAGITSYIGANYGPLAAGAVGGTAAKENGGNFGRGFSSAYLQTAIGPADTGSAYANVLVDAVVGGTIAEVSGGKFKNGAATGAFYSTLSQDWSKVEGYGFLSNAKDVLYDKDNHGKEHSLYGGRVLVSKYGSADAKVSFSELSEIRNALKDIFGTTSRGGYQGGDKMLEALSLENPLKILLNDLGVRVNGSLTGQHVITLHLKTKPQFRNFNYGEYIPVTTARLAAHEITHAVLNISHSLPYDHAINTVDNIMSQINGTRRLKYSNQKL